MIKFTNLEVHYGVHQNGLVMTTNQFRRERYWYIDSYPDGDCWIYASDTTNIHLDDDDDLCDEDDSESVMYFDSRRKILFIQHNYLIDGCDYGDDIKIGRSYSTGRNPS